MKEVVCRQEIITPEAGVNLVQRFIFFAQVSEKTADTYLKALRQMYGYFLLNGITQPEEEDLIAWKQALKQNHKTATINLYITAARLFFKWLEREGIYKDIAKYLKSEKISRDFKKDYLTTSQIKSILEAVDRESLQGKRDYAILCLAITGGLRTIEIARADIKDLTIRGDNTVLYVMGKGCNEKDRFIIVPAETEAAIREYLAARGTAEEETPLFVSTSNNNAGQRMTTRSISGILKKHIVAAGYDSERLTAHSMRHSSVTVALMQGAELTEVQQFARHSNVNTTMIYNHALELDNNSCSKKIAEAIF